MAEGYNRSIAAVAVDTHTTRGARDAVLDLLRSVALVRIVLWHALAATWLTAFAAIPLMFFVAGSLLAGSLDDKGHGRVMLRRARRLLLPLWLYGAVVAAVGAAQASMDGSPLELEPIGLLRALTWVLPFVDPAQSEWHAGWLSGHLWYLRAYLWILVLAPVLRAFARHPLVATALLALVVVQLEVARVMDVAVLGRGTTRVLIGDVLTYGLFAMLGMAHREWRAKLDRRVLLAGALACAGGALAFVRILGLPTGGLNASYGALALTGMAWVLAAGAAEPALRRVAEVAPVRRATSAVSRRAVTIYLWHPAAIVIAYGLVGSRIGRPVLAALALTPVLVWVAVLAAGFMEDVAAGRRRLRPPVVPALRGLALAPSIVVALAVAMPFLAEPLLASPIGSRGPARQAPVLAPPSHREALTNAAFAAGASTEAAPIRLRDARMPARQLQRALERWRQANPEVQSVAVALASNAKTWQGVSTAKGAAALDPDARYGTASLTKTFTAALVLRAADAGKIDLDAPVPRLPGVERPRRAAGITPRHLLQHTSGLVDYRAAQRYDATKPLEARPAVNLALGSPLQSPPGSRVNYASTNSLYLGLLLERVTGRPYAELLDELTDAVGLPGIFVHGGDAPGSVGHAAGGVHATLAELVTWTDTLLTPGRVLPPARVAQLTVLDQQHNLGLGTWPLCPCWTGPDGVKRYSGIGHHVGGGGMYRDPAGLTFAVRIEPAGPHAGAQVESLRTLLADVLRR